MKSSSSQKVSLTFERYIDPASGDITVEGKAGVGPIGFGSKTTTSLDHAQTTNTREGTLDFKQFKAGVSHAESENSKTGEWAQNLSVGVSKSVEFDVAGATVGAKATYSIANYQSHGKPTALDPGIMFVGESLTAEISVSASGKDQKHGFAAGDTWELAKVGSGHRQLMAREDIKQIFSEVKIEIAAFGYGNKYTLEYSRDEFKAAIDKFQDKLEQQQLELKRVQPHTQFEGYLRQEIELTQERIRTLKQAEVFAVAEEAETDLSRENSSWKKSSYENGAQVAYENQDGRKLYADRNTKYTLYQRHDGSVDYFSYTFPQHNLHKEFDFGDQKTDMIVGQGGAVLLSGQTQDVFVSDQNILFIPEDQSKAKLYNPIGQTYDVNVSEMVSDGVIALERKARWVMMSPPVIESVDNQQENGVAAPPEDISSASYSVDADDKLKAFIDEINKQKQALNEEQQMCLKETGGIDFD